MGRVCEGNASESDHDGRGVVRVLVGAEADFCRVYRLDGEVGAKKEGGMSSAVAGVVGAMVTLNGVALVGGSHLRDDAEAGYEREKGPIPPQRLQERRRA